MAVPRAPNLDRRAVLDAAEGLVRERGFDALSARALAARLGVSVAPVYGAFDSMEELQAALLERAAAHMRAAGEIDYSDSRLLNRGIGLVAFARDEPELFLALYRAGRSSPRAVDLLGAYLAEARERMAEDRGLSGLPPESLDCIFRRLWTYTLGMVAESLLGSAPPRTTETIALELREAGAFFIYGAARGIGDHGSERALEAWRELIERDAPGLSMEAVAPRQAATGRKGE